MKNLTVNEIITLLMIHRGYGTPGITFKNNIRMLEARGLIKNEIDVTPKGQKLIRVIKQTTTLI